MKDIKINIGTDEFNYKCPENWGELSGEQFEYYVAHQRKQDQVGILVTKHVLNIGEEGYWLGPIDWKVLSDELAWMLDIEQIDGWMLESLTLGDGREVFPPSPDFDNVSWEEWMFVDTSADNNQWDIVAACLYRPKKEHFSEEEDDRIPFTKYGASSRLPQFRELGPSTLKAIEVNYIMLRKRVTDKYKHIFVKGSKKVEGDEKQEKYARYKVDAPKRSSAGWLEIYRKMLGENVWEEEKFLRLPVNTVLSRLDAMIVEGREREREMKRARAR